MAEVHDGVPGANSPMSPVAVASARFGPSRAREARAAVVSRQTPINLHAHYLLSTAPLEDTPSLPLYYTWEVAHSHPA